MFFFSSWSMGGNLEDKNYTISLKIQLIKICLSFNFLNINIIPLVTIS